MTNQLRNLGGNTGDVLTKQDDGTWQPQAPSGGGAWELIGELDVTASETQNISGISAYKSVKIIGLAKSPSSVANVLALINDMTQYYTNTWHEQQGTNLYQYEYTGDAFLRLFNPAIATDHQVNFEITAFVTGNKNQVFLINSYRSTVDGIGDTELFNGGGAVYMDDGAFDRIKFSTNSSTTMQWMVQVFGVK